MQENLFNKLIDVSSYNEYFSEFYDANTFKEILNLMYILHGDTSDLSNFVKLITAGILHGHTPAYLSSRTYPNLSLSPSHQKSLNIRQKNTPEYRSLKPRILKKVATLSIDFNHSLMKRNTNYDVFTSSDARNLSYLKSESIDLITTSLPIPTQKNFISDNWLRLWFLKIPASSIICYEFSTIEDWKYFIKNTLIELARVIRCHRYLALNVKDFDLNEQKYSGISILRDILFENFQNYFQIISIFTPKKKTLKLNNCEIPLKYLNTADKQNTLILEKL